jgi:hypothetical protein
VLTKNSFQLVNKPYKSRPVYRSTDYTEEVMDDDRTSVDENKTFFDSEISSFPSILNLETDLESIPPVQKKPVKSRNIKRNGPSNYNFLKNQIL